MFLKSNVGDRLSRIVVLNSSIYCQYVYKVETYSMLGEVKSLLGIVSSDLGEVFSPFVEVNSINFC